MNLRRHLIVLVLAGGILLGYGAVSMAYPAYPPGVYGRAERHGYFLDLWDAPGDRVWKVISGTSEALPASVQGNVDNFIGFVFAKMDGPFQSNQDRVGGSFIVNTMISDPNNPQRNHPATGAQRAEWEARVRFAAAMGRIKWRESYSYVLNSYYQGCCGGGDWNDDGFYDGPGTFDAIQFGDGNSSNPADRFGNVIYAIKWACANPVGFLTQLPNDPNFNISATTNVDINNPLPGQTIKFTYRVTNTGPESSDTAHIFWGATDTLNGTQPIAKHDSGIYPVGRVDTQTEDVPIPAGTAPGTRICRRVDGDPANKNGGNFSSSEVCATVRYDFTLVPSIAVEINGAPVTDNVAEPGDTITFRYSVSHSGATRSQTVTCTYRQASYTGYNTTPPVTAFTPAGSTCAPTQVFTTSTTVATEGSVAANPLNTSICRSFTITPTSPSGGTQTVQACAFVAVKPYIRIYGGDVTTGGGVKNTLGKCDTTTNDGAAVIGWNRRNAGAWAGAGTKYAIYAKNVIYDFADALGNPPPSTTIAPKPHGLSFGNVVNDYPNGDFGGNFGSVPCMPDYYSRKPASAPSALSDVGLMATGNYFSVGPITLHGKIGSGFAGTPQRVVVYVDGDVLIDGNIQYPDNWSSGNPPMLMVVAFGNIYISRDVQRIDGLFVAQPFPSGGKGVIYTCSTPTLPTLPHTTLFIAQFCGTKLTVNGAFVARQIQFLRTNGTLRNSNANELSTSGNIAEVFNYSPALWMAQPSSSSGAADYDAINSLPPVL